MATKNTEMTTASTEEIILPQFEGMESVGLGFDGLDASDVAIRVPFMTLLQPTSKDVVASKGKLSAGCFLLNGEEQKQFEKLDITVIYFGKDRTMWSENFKRGDSPICRSFDGKSKVEDGCGSEQGCEHCEFAKFNKETKSSPCSQSYVLLCQNLEDGTLFKLKAGGASYKPAKEFIQKLYKIANKAGGNAFSFKTTIGSDFVSNDKGSFYTLNFGEIEMNKKLYPGKSEQFPMGVDTDYYKALVDTYKSYADSLAMQNKKNNLSTNDGSIPEVDFEPSDEDAPF